MGGLIAPTVATDPRQTTDYDATHDTEVMLLALPTLCMRGQEHRHLDHRGRRRNARRDPASETRRFILSTKSPPNHAH
jgi:hypothetical protein